MANLLPVSRPQAVNFATSTIGVVDTGGKFATGGNNTGGKVDACVNVTGGKLPLISTTPAAMMSMTLVANGNNIRLLTPYR